jgi:ATP-dependent Lon protease
MYGVGLAADYLSEALHALRSLHEADEYVDSRLSLTGAHDIRDETAVRSTAAGYVRLLYPNLKMTRKEFALYCAEPAVRYRQCLRDQLAGLDAEFSPAPRLECRLES